MKRNRYNSNKPDYRAVHGLFAGARTATPEFNLAYLREIFDVSDWAPARKRLKAPRQTKLWLVMLPDGRHASIRANTKSEARATVKQDLGMRRLPIGAGVLPVVTKQSA